MKQMLKDIMEEDIVGCLIRNKWNWVNRNVNHKTYFPKDICTKIHFPYHNNTILSNHIFCR
jgi:hypothetical protein